ncbi:MAG: hypothetical protein AAB348_02960 [Patescibacteria group bacterium]
MRKIRVGLLGLGILGLMLLGVFVLLKVDYTSAASAEPTTTSTSNIAVTSIRYNWVKGAGGDEMYFVVNQSTDGITFTLVTSTIPSTTVNYTFTGLATNTPYWFAVASVSSTPVATSTFATSSRVYTLAATSSAPTAGTPTASTIPLTINDLSGNPSTTQYAIFDNGNPFYYYNASGVATTSPVWQTTSTWGANFPITGLTANAEYNFMVIARNGDGTAAATSTSTGDVQTAANAPSSVSVSSAANSLSLSWTGDATGYYAEDITAGTNSGWITGTSFGTGSINCGTSHSFRVKGRNLFSVETDWAAASGSTNACGTAIPVGGGGSVIPTAPVTPPAPSTAQELATAAGCPTLGSGDMVKVTGKPAIYSVNKDLKILYFPSGDEFKSWNSVETYGGYKSITQACFDALPVPSTYPGAVNFRPGSYVVKRPSSDQLYVVQPGNTLAKISAADAVALYGAAYKVMTVADPFWPHYVNRGPDVVARSHQGMLVSKDSKTWYVDAGDVLREVTPAGMTANRFKSAFVRALQDSSPTAFTTGALIDAMIPSLTDRTQ